MIFLLSYDILQDKHKKLQKKNEKNKRKLKAEEGKKALLEEEIKILKHTINRRNKKIKEKNLIIGWLLDSDERKKIADLEKKINTMSKQIEEKDLIIGWLQSKK